MQTMTDSFTDSITAILQKLTDGISKTDKYGEKLTEISFKLSNHEERLEK